MRLVLHTVQRLLFYIKSTLSTFQHGSDRREQALENEENSKNADSISYHPEHKQTHKYLCFRCCGNLHEFLHKLNRNTFSIIYFLRGSYTCDTVVSVL